MKIHHWLPLATPGAACIAALTLACAPDSTVSPVAEELDYCPDYGFDASSLCTAIYAREGRGPAAVGDKRKRWSKTNLRVSFLGGSERLHRRVIKHAREWERACGIRFDFGPHADADIRVAFQCSGHWSWVGRDNQRVPAHKATMNLQLLDSDTDIEVRRVVLHEFGHAIGMEHEHQHPEATFKWDEEAVFKFYKMSQGWERDETRFQVLNRLEMTNHIHSVGFDPDSIMLYPINPKLTYGTFSSTLNTKLSARDIQWAAEAYPPVQ